MAESFYRAIHGLPQDFSSEKYRSLRESGWKGREDIVIFWGNVIQTRDGISPLVVALEQNEENCVKLQYGTQVRVMYSPAAVIKVGEELSARSEHSERKDAVLAELSRLKEKYGGKADSD